MFKTITSAIWSYLPSYGTTDSNVSKSEVKNERKYSWKRAEYDERDKYRHFEVVSCKLGSLDSDLPDKIDLREQCPPIYDQGKLGSCTANAIAGVYEFDQLKEGEKDSFIPSRLFIYYNERELENKIDEDAGGDIRTVLKGIVKFGICPEVMWPYDVSKFKEKPSLQCYEEGKKHQVVAYHRVKDDIDQLKQCLYEGYPLAFGMMVYDSFESEEVARTGIVSLPKRDEKLLGGHAVMMVGFDDEKEVFIIRNSWGEEWGDKGYFYIPYEFMNNEDLCGDFWTVTSVKDQA